MSASAHKNSLPDYIFSLSENHPLRIYYEENTFLKQLLTDLRNCPIEDDFLKFTNLLNNICEVEKRYSRKENQLFPFLEKHGWYGPSQGMWSFHDNIREIIRMIRLSMQKREIHQIKADAELLVDNITSLIYVEETRLFPHAYKILNEDEWEEMKLGESEIGWMDKQRSSAETSLNSGIRQVSDRNSALKTFLKLDEGHLSEEQVNLMLKFLPVDITFVDENDKVSFYNRGEVRVFPRSAGIIGREVRFCHPPKSVGKVLQIVEEFKLGRKDEAEFWINFKERLIHIRYFAVRDRNNVYKGVLEMSQDITDIQKIRGEKRLLGWGES